MMNNTRAKARYKTKHSKLKQVYYKERLFFTVNSFSGIVSLQVCSQPKIMPYQVSPSKHIVTTILLFLLTACSLNPALSKKEFIQYVNNVFQLQNQMTGEVMMLAETEQLQQYDRLLALEQNMHRDCRPLNEYAERENDGLKTGLMLKQQVKKAVYNCEQAALKVQLLLEDF